jgi:hypothetical protein
MAYLLSDGLASLLLRKIEGKTFIWTYNFF